MKWSMRREGGVDVEDGDVSCSSDGGGLSVALALISFDLTLDDLNPVH